MNQKFGYSEINVSLKKFIAKGHLSENATDKAELARLMRIVERDIREAAERCHEIDWQFAIAYNAALQLATLVVRASGYRASTKVGHHWVTFSVLPELLGDEFIQTAEYFNDCRAKRNTTEYGDTGTISQADVEKLLHEVVAFKKYVFSWLKKLS
jgi:hypothetical protein